jgi:hypothetical protein
MERAARRPPPSALARAAACAGAALLAGCPVGHRTVPADTAPRCETGIVDPAELRRHVEALAGRFLPRDHAHPANLDAAAAYLASAFRAAGASVQEQPYEVAGRRYRNVIASFGPDTPERIVVGAHYDAAEGTPGADDDASGVAGLLAAARLLARDPPPLRVELAAYTLEEPPYFRTASMGSAVHARSLRARGAAVRLMIAVEMIGTFSDDPGTQRYPTPIKRAIYPTKANFIAVVGRIGEAGAVREVAGALHHAGAVPVETIASPASLPGVDFSDHLNFWAEGWPAVMVTDTAFLRNPHYHGPGDVPERLDYGRMAEVVRGVHCAIEVAARR